MACPEFEDLISDYCEGAASPADSGLLESHIAACAACREWLAGQRELDLRLAKSIVAPPLSLDFAGRLAARIAAQPRAPRFRRLSAVLEVVGCLGIAATAGFLLQQLPHASDWVGLVTLAASAGYALWETGKALRTTHTKPY
ncbi:MAG TPA: zf-HC2 domain-containing protein [Bryobacteraceae bacterium]|nr:zf-HC2 domain-containing protein [Bryobacteraceae bacterium]